jgi:putative transcriptional regulator
MYNKLKQLRLKNNLTTQDMAYKLNISKTYYWQIENNKRKLSYEMSIKIGNIFKKKQDNIFYEDFIKENK